MTKKKIVLLLIAGGIVLFLISMFIPSKQLRALKNEARVLQLNSGREIYKHINDEGRVLEKPIYAEIDLKYEPINSHTKNDLINEINTILQKNNWKRVDGNLVPDYYVWTLKQENIFLRVSVLISNNNTVSVQFVGR